MILDKIPVRVRLSLGHAIWMAILFVGIGLGLYHTVENQLLGSIDSTLRSSAKNKQIELSLTKGSETYVFKYSKLNRNDNSTYTEEIIGRRLESHTQIIDVSGKSNTPIGSGRFKLPVTPLAISRAEKGIETFENFPPVPRPAFRLITMPLMKNGQFTGILVQIAAPLVETYRSLDQIFTILWIALAIGLLCSIGFGYVLSGSAFRPVRSISNTASKLAIDDLSIRLPIPKANDELREITTTFNGMLDRLEDSVKRLRRFTGDVSHELRTPLAVMRGEAELALRRERSGESYKETLGTIANEAIHMTGIIEDLLLLARAESKNVAINPEDIKAPDFVKELETISSAIFQKHQIQLNTQIDSNITFVASRKLFSLAVKNILENAAKHSPLGEEVSLKVYTHLNDIYFEIKDKGEGIPEESVPYIFDSFYRADTARNRGAGGVGIGLSLAMALIKLHSGDIKVYSKVNEGAKFIIRIPINNYLHENALKNEHNNLNLGSKFKKNGATVFFTNSKTNEPNQK